MPRLDAKRDLARVAATGLGTLLALWSTSWPDGPEAAWVSIGGGVAGLAVCLAVEYVTHLHREVRRLQDVERQLDAERAHHAQETKALREQTARAEYAAKVSAAHNGVWGGAYNELLGGTEVPFDALMARLEAAARNVGPPPPT